MIYLNNFDSVVIKTLIFTLIICGLYIWLSVVQNKKYTIYENIILKELSDIYVKASSTTNIDMLNKLLDSLYLIRQDVYIKNDLRIVQLRTYIITKLEMIEKHNLK